MKQFLVIMKPKLAYATFLKTYAMIVTAETANGARYAAELKDKTIFNNLDPHYAKLTAHEVKYDFATITI